MNFLRTLALAHQKHEGYGTKKAVTITKNNNPGALRWHSGQKIFGGEYREDFTWFPSYTQGFEALKADLVAKITGHSAHIDYSKNPTFLDYIKVYAPTEDSNNPNSYTQALVSDLVKAGYNVSPSTLLSVLSRYLQASNSVSDRIIQINYSRILRAFKRATGAAKRKLGRLLNRLNRK